MFGYTPSMRIRASLCPSAAGNKAARRSRSTWMRLALWPRGRSVRLTVTYKGGGEGWYLVQARGESGVFAGCVALEDVMARIYSER